MKRATVSGRRARTRSFSLVEVVIALGVITVGIVGILGVFPTSPSQFLAALWRRRRRNLAMCGFRFTHCPHHHHLRST